MTVSMQDRDQALLADRARALARTPVAEPAGAVITVVTFELAKETYGIDARYVCGLFRLMDLAPFPGARPPTVGLTSWRGDLLAVIDPRLMLSLGAAALDDRSWIVAVGRETPRFGMLAGALKDVMTVPHQQVRPAPGARSGADRSLVSGLTDDAILLLDGERLLAGPG